MSLLFPTLAPHTLEILQSAVDENAALCKEEERQELEFETLREEGKLVWYPGKIFTDPNHSDLDPVEDEEEIEESDGDEFE